MVIKRTAEQLADVLFPEALEQDDFADGVFSTGRDREHFVKN